MPSTSPIDLPRTRISSVSGLYRAPWHVGHGAYVPGRDSSSTARLAAAAGNVDRDPPGRVAAAPRLVGRGEHLAHRVEHPRVGGEVGPRGSADRLLVDADQPVERLEADRVHAGGAPLRAVLD